MTSTTGTKNEVVLYSYWRSSCSWRVRLILALKGIKYKYVPVHLREKEQHGNDFVSLNPSAQVPVLLIDGQKLCESVAIAEYLEETRPENALLPRSPAERAKVRHIVELVNSGIQPKQNLAVLNYIAQHLGGDAEKLEWAKHWISLGFAAVEKALVGTAGKYAVGDSITFADCFLVPQVFNSQRFGVDLSAYPTVRAVSGRLADLPAFKAAHPDAQIDANT